MIRTAIGVGLLAVSIQLTGCLDFQTAYLNCFDGGRCTVEGAAADASVVLPDGGAFGDGGEPDGDAGTEKDAGSEPSSDAGLEPLSWSSLSAPAAPAFNAVHGVSATDLYVAASSGGIFRYSNGTWSEALSNAQSSNDLHGLWVSATGEVYAGGDGQLVACAANCGDRDSYVVTTVSASITDLCGAEGLGVYAVGNASVTTGVLYRFDSGRQRLDSGRAEHRREAESGVLGSSGRRRVHRSAGHDVALPGRCPLRRTHPLPARVDAGRRREPASRQSGAMPPGCSQAVRDRESSRATAARASGPSFSIRMPRRPSCHSRAFR